MNYDFLSFIDSKAIREFNRDHAFTPAEQAVIITFSFKKTLDEKIEALEYLYNTYGNEEFGEDKVGCRSSDREKPFRTRLAEYITALKKALADRDMTGNCVYIAGEREEGFVFSKQFFSDYQKAYEYLQRCFEENKADERYIYSIKRVMLDKEHRQSYEYRFDSDMRLIFADTDSLPDDADLLISEYYVDIPLPFKKGELIKCINPHRLERYYRYYVASGNAPNRKWVERRLQHGADYTDMCMTAYSYYCDSHQPPCTGQYDFDHLFPLSYDFCESGDMDKISKPVKYLSCAMSDSNPYSMTHLLIDFSRGLNDKYTDEMIDGFTADIIKRTS